MFGRMRFRYEAEPLGGAASSLQIRKDGRHTSIQRDPNAIAARDRHRSLDASAQILNETLTLIIRRWPFSVAIRCSRCSDPWACIVRVWDAHNGVVMVS